MRHPALIAVLLVAGGCSSNKPGNNSPDMSMGTMSPDGGMPGSGDMAGTGSSADMPPASGVSVLQLHNHASRDGVYVDPALTVAAVANLHKDSAFDGTYAQTAGAGGSVYAQPLFVDGGGANDLVIVATEKNYVLAFDATTGKVKWHTDASVIGTAAPASAFSCGNVDPSGITGTPAIDLGTRAMFFQADVVQSGTTKHLIHSISIDDGSERAGWPIDVASVIPTFDSKQQGERGGLVIVGSRVYVPFGGRAGDCTPYRGYVVGLPLSNPTAAAAVVFQTKASDGGGKGLGVGIWSPAGLSSDGTSIYFVTGNTMGTFPNMWTQTYSEGVFRLPQSLAFDLNDTTSYFSPPDWLSLDMSDTDISGSGILLVDLPGAAKPHLGVVLGKDQKMYLLDRTNLGGAMTTPPFSGGVASSEIINSPSVYTTTTGTWVAFRAQCPAGGAVTINGVRLTSAPAAGMAWCANVEGGGSPVFSTSGGGKDGIVWFVSTEGEGITPDYKLYGFNADTGATIIATPAMSPSHRFISPIIAKGRIYVATDAQLYAFTTK